jgi:hypothetical protein
LEVTSSVLGGKNSKEKNFSFAAIFWFTLSIIFMFANSLSATDVLDENPLRCMISIQDSGYNILRAAGMSCKNLDLVQDPGTRENSTLGHVK